MGRDDPADRAGDSIGVRRVDGDQPMLIGDFFGNSIVVLPQHDVLKRFARRVARRRRVHAARRHDAAVLARDLRDRRGLVLLPRQSGGVRIASRRHWAPIYTLLDNKYYFDRFNDWFFAGGARAARRHPVAVRRPRDHRRLLRQRHGPPRRLDGFALRHMQSGYVYHYAFTMILGVFALLTYWTR